MGLHADISGSSKRGLQVLILQMHWLLSRIAMLMALRVLSKGKMFLWTPYPFWLPLIYISVGGWRCMTGTRATSKKATGFDKLCEEYPHVRVCQSGSDSSVRMR